MQTDINNARRSERDYRGQLLAFLETQWPSVRVESLELPDTQRAVTDVRARARVELARLTPADVCVELVRVDAEEPARRMWSVWGSGNGHFVFEAALPFAAYKAEGQYRVQVTPNAARVGAAEVEAVLGPSLFAD